MTLQLYRDHDVTTASDIPNQPHNLLSPNDEHQGLIEDSSVICSAISVKVCSLHVTAVQSREFLKIKSYYLIILIMAR